MKIISCIKYEWNMYMFVKSKQNEKMERKMKRKEELEN